MDHPERGCQVTEAIGRSFPAGTPEWRAEMEVGKTCRGQGKKSCGSDTFRGRRMS